LNEKDATVVQMLLHQHQLHLLCKRIKNILKK